MPKKATETLFERQAEGRLFRSVKTPVITYAMINLPDVICQNAIPGYIHRSCRQALLDNLSGRVAIVCDTSLMEHHTAFVESLGFRTKQMTVAPELVIANHSPELGCVELYPPAVLRRMRGYRIPTYDLIIFDELTDRAQWRGADANDMARFIRPDVKLVLSFNSSYNKSSSEREAILASA